MKKKIIIFGCGGHARSIINTIVGNGDDMDILLTDNKAKNNERVMGYPVVRNCKLYGEWNYIIAIGNNAKRKEMYNNLQYRQRGKCISIISHMSCIGSETEIGIGTFIAPYAYVGPQAKIGNNVIVNTGSIVEHETIIGNHTHIAPHATLCGRSKIGNNVFCGADSTVIDNINICDDVIIGAGAVVTKDIMESGIYIGIPARKVDDI